MTYNPYDPTQAFQPINGGGSGVDPYSIAAMAASTIGNLVGGNGQESSGGDVNYVAPEQRVALLELLKQQYYGGGDALGPLLRQGQATLGQTMAQRGINPMSGIYANAQSNMYGNAIAQAAQNRFQNLGQLIQMTPATTNIKGGLGFGNWAANQDQGRSGHWSVGGFVPDAVNTVAPQSAPRFGSYGQWQGGRRDQEQIPYSNRSSGQRRLGRGW